MVGRRSEIGEAYYLGQFLRGFYERFFPATAQKEMEEQFIKLQQFNRSVDEYDAEFLRLSRFAPYMVGDEEKRANRFQQGLKMDIQYFLSLSSSRHTLRFSLFLVK